MKKLIFVLGFLCAGLVLLQINNKDLTVDDAMDMVVRERAEAGVFDFFQRLFKEEEVIEEPKSVKVLAFGDMMLGRYVRTLMDKHGKDYIFDNIPLTELQEGMDIVHGNLEGPINGQGRSGGTAMVFSFNRDIGPFLAEKGFNLLSISNNHAVDMGWDARNETIEVLESAGIDWCGHPSEVPRESVYFGETETASFAFVCLHDVTFRLDVGAAERMIAEVDKEVDFVVVSIHWGYEYQHTANQSVQVEPAHRFVDAGADFVIGHHPHVVQNFEVYKGVPIFYSLGNFVFDQYWAKNVQEELAIKFEIQDEGYEIELIPMKSELSQSRLMNEGEKAEWFERFIGYGNYSEEIKAMIRNGKITLQRESF